MEQNDNKSIMQTGQWQLFTLKANRKPQNEDIMHVKMPKQ